MKKLKSIAAILSMSAFLALGAGCGNDLVKKFEDLADEACKCKDAECAKGIGEKMMKILEGVDKDDEPSKGDQEKIMKAMDKIQKCTTKLTMPGAAGGAE